MIKVIALIKENFPSTHNICGYERNTTFCEITYFWMVITMVSILNLKYYTRSN